MHAINATLYQKLPYNFIRDIAPVVGFARVPNVMEVHPSVPVGSVAEFIAYARSNPGTLNMASSGSGTTIHLGGELFKAMAGVNLLHVPYRGSAPALTDLLSGRVQVMFDNAPSSIAHIRAGKLRALAVTTLERSAGVQITKTHSFEGDPSGLHPATRRLLQAEVAKLRQDSAARTYPWLWLLHVFWGRLVLTLSIFLVLGVAAWLFLRTVEKPKQPGQFAKKGEETAPARPLTEKTPSAN